MVDAFSAACTTSAEASPAAEVLQKAQSTFSMMQIYRLQLETLLLAPWSARYALTDPVDPAAAAEPSDGGGSSSAAGLLREAKLAALRIAATYAILSTKLAAQVK